jgi:hypothetical protein
MMGEQGSAMRAEGPLDQYCGATEPRLVAVVDANALISSVANDCRRGTSSRLRRMTAFGSTILYASDHVYFEVYRRLPRLVGSSGTSAAQLRNHFETHYLPRMRFVSVSTANIVDPQVLAITDPDDVPTGQLAKLLGPCIVFSEDKHLKKPGLAPLDWRLAAAAAADLAEAVGVEGAAGNLMMAPVWTAVAVAKAVASRLGLSPWAIGILATAAAVPVFMDADRRAATSRGWTRYGAPVLSAILAAREEARLQQQSSTDNLREKMLPGVPSPTLKQQIAIALARATEPLLAREVRDRIEWHFQSDGQVPTVRGTREVLRSEPEFTAVQRYRWELGSAAGPLGS